MPVSLLFAAAENPDPMASEPWVAGTALVVFVVAFGFLYLKVWPVITKGLDDRNDKILGEIKAAEDARSQASQAWPITRRVSPRLASRRSRPSPRPRPKPSVSATR